MKMITFADMSNFMKFLSLKHLVLLLLLGFASYSCQNNNKGVSTDVVNNPKSADEKGDKQAMPQISFTKTEHDFGKLIQGEQLSVIFKFENTGNAPLLITKVSASCGCTASKYPTEPIAPGEEGRLEVTFDSKGQRGMQNKTVTVLTNTQPKSTTLRLRAQVSTPDSY
ncbi:MAG: DUF1573 domain-containing protein [Bacteroidetes bacterium]|nr:DUF1573 domain-containing protein [Bacteroidota bacterium]